MAAIEVGVEGERLYSAELLGGLDGLRVKWSYTPSDEVFRGELEVMLLDDLSGEVVSGGNFLVKPKAVVVEGRAVMEFNVEREGGEGGEYSDEMMTLAGWFVQLMHERSRVRLGGGKPVKGEELGKDVGRWWKGSRMEEFFGFSKLELRGGVSFEMEFPEQFDERGWGYMYAKLTTPDGTESVFEGFVGIADEGYLAVVGEVWSGSLTESLGSEVGELVEKTLENKWYTREESWGCDMGAGGEIAFLVLRWLRYWYGEVRMWDNREQKMLEVSWDEDEWREKTDAWLGF